MGVHYVSQTYDERKWALAAAAAKRVMDMGRYTLHTAERVYSKPGGDATEVTPELPENVSNADFPYGAGNIDPLKSYTNMFNGTTYPVQNKELIWGKYSDKIRDYTRQSFPILHGRVQCDVPDSKSDRCLPDAGRENDRGSPSHR